MNAFGHKTAGTEAMIELLLKLIDRLIELKKYRSERLLRVFKEILEPTFDELVEVHRNYVGMFADVAAMIPPPGTPPERRIVMLTDAANALRRKRLEFDPIRRKVATVATEIFGGRFGKQREFMTPPVDEFVRSVLDYFPTGYLTTASAQSRATMLYGAIRAGGSDIGVTDVAEPGNDALLSTLVEETIRDSEQRWQRVSNAFVHLKLTIHTSV